MQRYPKYLFHRTEPARVVQDQAEHEALGEGWEETPTAFADEASSIGQDSSKAGMKPPITEMNLISKKVEELRAMLIEKGVSAEELKGLKKDELIAKIGAI